MKRATKTIYTLIITCLVVCGIVGGIMLLKNKNNNSNSDVVNPATCTHEKIEVVKAIDPTCLAEGRTEGRTCKTCGKVFAKSQAIAALGHNWSKEYTIEKEATCTESGLQYHLCTRTGCNAHDESVAILALGHETITYVEEKAATCTEAGTTAGVKCTRCDEIITAAEEIAALGHNYSSTYTTITAATCTTAGSKSHTCTRCGDVETVSVAALGHSYSLEDICTRCGLGNAYGVNYAVDALGNAYAYAGKYFNKTEVYISSTYKGHSVTIVKDFSTDLDFTSPSQVADTLKIVHIPSSVEEIADNAFKGCASLTFVDMADGVKRIGHYAFAGTSLESLYIPSSVTSVGQMICGELEKVKSSGLIGSVVYTERIITISFGGSSLPSVETLTSEVTSGVSVIGTITMSNCSYASTIEIDSSSLAVTIKTSHNVLLNQSRPVKSIY